jgi:isoleucyl-tRNA synthetase
VHLCDYPVVDSALIDEQLSADMKALLRLVSLGSAARNAAKIKVRQPLAELKIQPANEQERRAVERFADQLCEELNIRQVTLHDPSQGALLRTEVKANPKTLGPKFGPRMAEVKAALEKMNPEKVVVQYQGGGTLKLGCPGGPVTLEAADVILSYKAAEGGIALADRGTQVMIDTRITQELALAGMAREVVRYVQDLRKKAGLEMEDRIVLSLGTDAPLLKQAIDAHRDYIAAETLVAEWATQPLDGDSQQGTVKIEGLTLVIQLRKAAPSSAPQ